MDNQNTLKKMEELFSQLDRENQITALNMLRHLHMSQEDEQYHKESNNQNKE